MRALSLPAVALGAGCTLVRKRGMMLPEGTFGFVGELFDKQENK